MSGDVVLYATSWCGYCRQAREYFKKKGVKYVEKDLEKDEGAAEELATKASAAGVRPQGVPVIDVKGKLILGFDRPALEEAL
ncbi:MAG: NrdH-redoxin [Myxococcales bacterium]|nr:NrdH-redoxin [Myxococcales bacterium]